MALNQVGLERLNTATTNKIGTNKNIIINGAMEVAQRGTLSHTPSGGYHTVDRLLLVFLAWRSFNTNIKYSEWYYS
jgi:hypothetical protein